MSDGKSSSPNIGIFCVGNKLMLDDGLGPAVFDQFMACYEFPDNVSVFDVGCLSLDMIDKVDSYDYIITIDALDGTESRPGTVFEFKPEDMARRGYAMQSLHELKLIDLFDAASLLGYSCEGNCFGVQVENGSPSSVTVGLTEAVYNSVPLLIDAVLADLLKRGIAVKDRKSGDAIPFGHHHEWVDIEDGI